MARKYEIHVFDVDGTLVDSREATKAAYDLAAPGLFKDEFWGLPAHAWGCPVDVHDRKVAEFSRLGHMVQPAWAMPMLQHADEVRHSIIMLTGASEGTMAIHRKRFKVLAGYDYHCGLTNVAKHEFLESLVHANPGVSIHYYDDAEPENLSGIVGDLDIQVHVPLEMPHGVHVVVLAAGLGSRFVVTGVPKPLIRYGDVSMLDRAILIAKEVNPNPIVVTIPEVVAATRDAQVRDTVKTQMKNVRPVIAHVTQRGPAESALLAGSYINQDSPVVFLDCDTCLSPGTLRKFVAKAHLSGSNAAVLVAGRGDNVGTYGTIDNGVLVEGWGPDDVHWLERRNPCLVGAYYIQSWHLFKRAHAMVYLGVAPSQEIKFSAILSRLDLQPIHTDTINWIPLGTPEELAHANQGAL